MDFMSGHSIIFLQEDDPILQSFGHFNRSQWDELLSDDTTIVKTHFSMALWPMARRSWFGQQLLDRGLTPENVYGCALNYLLAVRFVKSTA